MRVHYLIPLILLAACDRTGPEVTIDTGGGNIAVDADAVADAARGAVQVKADGDRLSLKLPGLNASVTVPDLNMDGGDIDLDGMAVHPGTKLAGMDVDGDRDGGTVTMRFTDPAAPAQVADHYVKAAPAAGYTLDASRPDRVSGHKREAGKDSRFAIALRPAGSGTEGTITVGGG